MGISSAGDFLGTTLSYTAIRDPILRLCNRLITCSIAGRSQAPEKVFRFYCQSWKEERGALYYLYKTRGQFVASLADHFGLLTTEILGGLTIIAPELPVIDMAELVRLQIYVDMDDTWAWVAMGPERQPDAAAGAPADAEDAPIIDEGGQADPAPIQAPQHIHLMPPTRSPTLEALGGYTRDLDSFRKKRDKIAALQRSGFKNMLIESGDGVVIS
ncbi:hypothetical protein Tco_1576118 [Tanacetum coccineum]